ncbi:MAG: hypothetical protein PHG05_03360 [Candidatus Nanoarchaeia archaeon]|nr:hypothetical protein [Candidatus Nanoarchaeia archaeon]
MKYQIAVLGTHQSQLLEEIYRISKDVGKEIALKGHILITGVSTGVSQNAAIGAKTNKGIVIGISPNNKDEFSESIRLNNHDFVIKTGLGYKFRNILTIRNSDGIIVINGSFGTLNEVTIAVEENKPIVIIENTGGCSNLIKEIFEKLNPEYSYIRYVNNASDAVNGLLEMLDSKIDVSYIDGLTDFFENSNENEVNSKQFYETARDIFQKEDLKWLDVGTGPGTKLINILEKIKNRNNISIEVIEPSKVWLDKFLKNFRLSGLSNHVKNMYNCIWEEFDINKKYDLITFFHSVYGIKTESLKRIPEMLAENGIACIVVESHNSALNKIKKSLFPYIHHKELMSSSKEIIEILEKYKINYKVEESKEDQRFYVDNLLNKEDKTQIRLLSFILQTKIKDHKKLISKEVTDKLEAELKKYIKIDGNNNQYISIPDTFIWISK